MLTSMVDAGGAPARGGLNARREYARLLNARKGVTTGGSGRLAAGGGSRRRDQADAATSVRSRRATPSLAAFTLASTSSRVITSSGSGPAPAAQLATIARLA